MLKNLFSRKKNSPKELQVKPADFEYLGDIEGNGVQELRFELAKCLMEYPKVTNAWFSRIKHQTEEKIRISLLVDAQDTLLNEKHDIAKSCAGIVQMDIMFTESLLHEFMSKVKENSAALYVSDYKLFQCPIIVELPEDSGAPKEWIGAISTIYVADTNYEQALLRAVEQVKLDGYQYNGVHDNKVSQIDPALWWEGHVLANWETYSDHFPSQKHIHALVRCGGIHKGPMLGWNQSSEI